jgi:ferritin
MNKKVYKVFNEQVQAELYSAYMYLAMSLDMEAKNYKGMAKWLSSVC